MSIMPVRVESVHDGMERSKCVELRDGADINLRSQLVTHVTEFRSGCKRFLAVPGVVVPGVVVVPLWSPFTCQVVGIEHALLLLFFFFSCISIGLLWLLLA